MGLIAKLIGAKVIQKVAQRVEAKHKTAAAGEYIAANATHAVSVAKTRGNALVGSAATFARQNPKLVATVGTAVIAALVAALAKKRPLH